MKVVTANRLRDGVAVWLGDDNNLVDRFGRAALLSDDEAAAALARVVAQTDIVANAYIIEADASGPVGRDAWRETIRCNGPSIRLDLGKQAEAINDRL